MGDSKPVEKVGDTSSPTYIDLSKKWQNENTSELKRIAEHPAVIKHQDILTQYQGLIEHFQNRTGIGAESVLMVSAATAKANAQLKDYNVLFPTQPQDTGVRKTMNELMNTVTVALNSPVPTGDTQVSGVNILSYDLTKGLVC